MVGLVGPAAELFFPGRLLRLDALQPLIAVLSSGKLAIASLYCSALAASRASPTIPTAIWRTRPSMR